MHNKSVRLFTPEAEGSPPFINADPTVGQILDWYQDDAARHCNSAEAEKERRRIWAICRHALGRRRVADCKAFDLLSLINAQKGLRSDNARRRWNGTLQRPFNAAERLGLIVKNPFRGLSFPAGDEGRDWTEAEWSAMMRLAPLPFRRVLVWIRYSGMRPGEVRGLLADDVRIDQDKIVIDKHKTRHVTKHAKAIPLNSVLQRLLELLQRDKPPSAKHLFLNSFGRPWTCQALTKSLRRIRRKAGLSSQVKLHGGRHTFGTGAIINEVGLPAVMEIMGHRRLATTQRYLHLANKVDHLSASMEQAVKVRTKPRKTSKKAPQSTPLFDLLP